MSDNETQKVEYLSEWPPPSDLENLQELSKFSESPKRIRAKKCEELIIAKTSLAIWYRKCLKRGQISSAKSNSKNPKTILNAFKKTQEARKYLENQLQDLIDDSPHWINSPQASEYYYTIATFYDELEKPDKCWEYSNLALDKLKLNPSEMFQLDNEKFVNELTKLDELTKEIIWLNEKSKLATKMIHKRLEEDLPQQCFNQVDVRDGSSLSKEEFLQEYVLKSKPVVINGMHKEIVPLNSKWDLDFVKQKAGSKKVMLKKRDIDSNEWARLDCVEEMFVKDFIEKLQKNETNLYLFDWSLPLFCTELESEVQIPKYFDHDYLKQTSDDALYHKSWPSLFVAPRGVISDLHVDAFASNFWMFLFQGQKKWTFFHRDLIAYLKPNYTSGFDPVFDEDLTRNYLIKPCEVILQPGQLLFVPHGSPHKVENLEDSIAISGNFVDHSNIQETEKHLKINALCNPRASDLLLELSRLKKKKQQASKKST